MTETNNKVEVPVSHLHCLHNNSYLIN